jgi:hypothetical protein
MDRPLGETPSGRSLDWKGSVREVSAYSTVGPEFA